MTDCDKEQPKVKTKSNVQLVTAIRRVLVFKNSKVWKTHVQSKLQDLTVRVSDIVRLAALFIKLYLIDQFEILESQGLDIQSIADQFSKSITLDEQFIKHCLRIVSSDKEVKKGRPPKDLEALNKLFDKYTEYASKGCLPIDKPSGSNLSFVFGYSAVDMKTNISNNVCIHYSKYIKRWARSMVRTVLMVENGISEWKESTSKVKSQCTKDSTLVIKELFGTEYTEAFPLKYALVVRQIKPFVSAGEKDLSSNVVKYLVYMMYVNRQLEHFGVKQYSPIPLSQSFVPRHFTLDYTALVTAVLDEAMVSDLNIHMKAQGWVLAKDKAFTKSQYQFINKPKNFIDESLNETHFRTDVWKFFTCARIHDKYKDLVFNNMVTTNGYTTSVHYADIATYFRKRTEKGIKVVAEPQDPFVLLRDLDEEQRTYILKSKILLACDPGKAHLVTIGNGEKDNPVLQYHSKDRQFAGAYKAKKMRATMLKSYKCPFTDKTYGVLQDTIKTSSKSCVMSTFQQYLREYWSVSKSLDHLYQRMCFRRTKYTTRLRQQSVEDKFLHKLTKTFDPQGQGSNIVLAYGNWGRNPNLKNSAPTPGIGLRRKIHSRVQTYTICEKGTSSVCPSILENGRCNSSLCHPIVVEKEQEDPDTGVKSIEKVHVHHILRCQNEVCKRRWDRDILAVANQIHQAKHILQFGVNSPDFENTTRPVKLHL